MPLWEEAGEDGLADEMLAGWIYEVLEEKGGFLRIRTHYAYEGWMDAAEYAPVPANEKSRRSMYMVGVHAADVLAGPKVQEKRLITLFAGSLVSICEESRTQDDWVRIALPDGREGYTRTHFLMPRRDSDAFLESGRLLELPELDEDGEAALRQEIVDRALSFLGTQYRWGGKTAMGIDCSGLAFMSYLMCGFLIYRDARIVPGFPVHAISAEQARKGDLFFFPGHVAVCLGEGRFVHATAYPGCGCVTMNSLKETDPDYRKDLKESLVAVGSIFRP